VKINQEFLHFLLLVEATKPDPVSRVRAQASTIRNQVFENMNRRTAKQGTAEYRSEKHCLILSKTSAVRNFLFDLPAIASRSGEAGGYSILKLPVPPKSEI